MKDKEVIFIDKETLTEEEMLLEDTYESDDEGL